MPSTILVPGQPRAPQSLDSDFAALRLVKVPDGAPPFDCEPRRTVRPAAVCPVAAASSDDAPRQAGSCPPAVSPAVAGSTAAWPRHLIQVMVEILAGVRPMRQADTLTTDRTRVQIRSLAPALASNRQPRIRRVMAFCPTARAVEVTVVASFGPRTRAVAMRFEQVAARRAAPGLPARQARWLCTEIEGA